MIAESRRNQLESELSRREKELRQLSKQDSLSPNLITLRKEVEWVWDDMWELDSTIDLMKG